jgi:hypothetical protein
MFLLCANSVLVSVCFIINIIIWHITIIWRILLRLITYTISVKITGAGRIQLREASKPTEFGIDRVRIPASRDTFDTHRLPIRKTLNTRRFQPGASETNTTRRLQGTYHSEVSDITYQPTKWKYWLPLRKAVRSQLPSSATARLSLWRTSSAGSSSGTPAVTTHRKRLPLRTV